MDLINATAVGSEPEFTAAGGRITKRQLQALATKDKIYRAALNVINDKGYNNVNIEDITSEANVAKGTFYTHFESKEAIVLYTFEQSDEIYARAYEKVAGRDFLYMITQFVRISYTEYEKRGKGIIKAIIANYFSFPENSVYGEQRRLYQCLSHIMESGKLEGVLDANIPTSQYVVTMVSTMIGVEVMWCFDREGQSLAHMMENAVTVTAKGMMQG